MNCSEIAVSVGSRSIPVLKSLQPSYLFSLLLCADSVKHLRPNNPNKFKVPRIETKIGARAFSVFSPTLWNLLPAHLRVAKHVSSFRKLLKVHFFDLAFPP